MTIKIIQNNTGQKGKKGQTQGEKNKPLATSEAAAELRDAIADEHLENPGGNCCGNDEEFYSYYPGHPLYRRPKAIIDRKARLFKERGVGKRPSRIYVKDPCKGPM